MSASLPVPSFAPDEGDVGAAPYRAVMETWITFAGIVSLAVGVFAARELVRRSANALLDFVALVLKAVLRACGWLLVGWWVTRLRRWFTGVPW